MNKFAKGALLCSLAALVWPLNLGASSVLAATVPSVAVVVDSLTYQKVTSSVDGYVKSLGKVGKKGILLVDNWGVPDSIRVRLEQMYRKANLEGAVLVGDIPVAMIRDAQHMCSAFKMDQKYKMIRSSVPSDRFYDDFSLKFKYIGREDKDSRLFYYSLASDSAQKVHCDIYSSRIRPGDGEDKYAKIAAFLDRAAAAKEKTEVLDRALLFAGHGYNSESMVARIHEYGAMSEQLKTASGLGGRIDFINFDFDKSVKTRLLRALSEKDLDLAVLHHHGAPKMQYMNGSPYENTPDGWLGLAKNYFRGKIRSASDKEATRSGFVKRFGIPESWLDEADDPEIARQDSIYAAGMDIQIEDIDNYSPQAKVMVIDACFNGAFINDDYIASRYVFNDSSSVLTVRAHSVNTLQDTWETESLGLLDRGVCVGNWFRAFANLDSHLFGDPTFSFGSDSQVDKIVREKRCDAPYQRKILKKSDDADLRCLAIRNLQECGKISSSELLSIQKTDKSQIVRLAALLANVEMDGDCLSEAIICGMGDNYELTRRMALKYAEKRQDPAFLPVLEAIVASPTTSAREIFHAKIAINSYDSSAAKEDIDNLTSDNINEKDAVFFVRSNRNGVYVYAIEPMRQCYQKTSSVKLKMVIAETFGWYVQSCCKQQVIDICKSLYSTEKDASLKDELLKTLKRLDS